MPTSTEEALRDFFNDERLDHYRDLHEQFPLWCGDWPEPECLEPEYGEWWSGGARLVAAWSEAFGGEIMGVVDADSDDAPQKYLIGPPHVEGPVALKDLNEVEETASFKAVVEALDLCFAVPESERDDLAHLIDSWTESLRDLANPKSDRFVVGTTASGRVRRGLPVNHPDPVNLWYAARLRRRILEAPLRADSRTELIKELDAYWCRIGREIDVIPTVGKGGPDCNLLGEFLAELLTQAQQLVVELIRLQPTPKDLLSVRQMLVTESGRLSAVQRELLDSLSRQAERDQISTEEVERRRAQILENVVPDDEAIDWVRRLMFPMLIDEEIQHVGRQTGWKKGVRKISKVASYLTASRLPIKRSTLENRARPFRQ